MYVVWLETKYNQILRLDKVTLHGQVNWECSHKLYHQCKVYSLLFRRFLILSYLLLLLFTTLGLRVIQCSVTLQVHLSLNLVTDVPFILIFMKGFALPADNLVLISLLDNVPMLWLLYGYFSHFCAVRICLQNDKYINSEWWMF